MADIIHRIGMKAPVNKVYTALSTINGLSHWWTEKVEGIEKPGGKIQLTFQETSGEIKGTIVMQVKELLQDKEVRWVCREGPPEWIDTVIEFQLSFADDQTIILFGHKNWREAVEFMAHCSMKWAVFLLSLKDYLEKGKGKPHPNDLKIDNWN